MHYTIIEPFQKGLHFNIHTTQIDMKQQNNKGYKKGIHTTTLHQIDMKQQSNNI